MPSLETYFWKNIQIGDAVVRRRQRNFGIITFNYHIYSGWGKVGAELWHLHMWGGCVGWRGACPMWNHRGAHFCRAYSEINPSIPRSGGRGRGRVRRWYRHTRAQHSHVAAHTSAAILHPARDVSAYRHVPHGFVCKYTCSKSRENVEKNRGERLNGFIRNVPTGIKRPETLLYLA